MFSYYGSKSKIVHLYPSPKCDLIIEPFAGAAAYSMLHYNHDVHLYDIDWRIVMVWKWLILATKEDILSLPILKQGDDLRRHRTLSDIEKLFLGYMINAGSNAPKNIVTKWMNWDDNKRKQIADNVSKVNHWKADQLDFRSIPNTRATWFIDPPYQDMGLHYDNVLVDDDFDELSEVLHGWEGQKIVCDLVEADWLDFEPLTENHGQVRSTMEGIYISEN